MYVSKNGANLMTVNEINALQITNANQFGFQFTSSGAVSISWGDGNVTNYSTAQSSYVKPLHNYSSTGTWNISISNPQNITGIYFYFGSGWYGEKINTNVIWFKQFYNLTKLELYNSTFTGELGVIINNYLTKLVYITYYYSNIIYVTSSINVSNCKTFWTIATYININSQGYNNIVGKLDDINVNLNCTFIQFNVHSTQLSGNIDGIYKNGYSSVTSFYLYTLTMSLSNLINVDDWIIPNTLLAVGAFRGLTNSHGNLVNFNFNNLTNYSSEGRYDKIDLTSNTSFNNFATNCNNMALSYLGTTYTKINLNSFNKTNGTYISIIINTTKNYNLSYGDITNILNKSSNTVWITGGKNDSAIYGNLTTTFQGIYLVLGNIEVSLSASDFKILCNRTSILGIDLLGLTNFTGDISNANFAAPYNSVYGIQIASMSSGLTADVTTFTYNSTFYYSTYATIDFSYNPGFIGNLANLTLWSNKAYIKLNNCNYTGIPGLVRNIFTNRNTCLKSAGGMTYIYVNGNIDNSGLTGTYQLGNLGTYSGNTYDLTENQIDNLANGLDYTGTGTNTAWTDKEKIYCLSTFHNSSTDSSLRYRASITY